MLNGRLEAANINKFNSAAFAKIVEASILLYTNAHCLVFQSVSGDHGGRGQEAERSNRKAREGLGGPDTRQNLALAVQ